VNCSFPNQRYFVNQEFSVHDGTFQAISSTTVSNGSAYWSQNGAKGTDPIASRCPVHILNM
jgi:hypothetical protein